MRLSRVCLPVLPLALFLALCVSSSRAHDASSWGGLFRSRDYGATWFPANPGRFVSAAIALAISPTDVNHLLLATDSGLLRSRNGGRDWNTEAPTVLAGPVFAAAFATDGQRAIVSTGLSIFRSEAEDDWRQTPVPAGAVPARAIVRGSEAGRVYLAGWTGLSRSDDWGASWSLVTSGLPDGPATALVVASGPPEIVYVIVGGRIWASTNGGDTWLGRTAGIPPINIDVLAVDTNDPALAWAAGADQLFRSNDGGVRWQSVGRPLPEPNTTVRGIAATGNTIVLTTDRGLFRSADRAQRWDFLIENLPAHLEAGPLVRGPVDPATLYAGFAITPYPELWRRVVEGTTALGRINVTSLAGGVIFLMIVALGALVALRRLGRYYRGNGKTLG